MIVPIAGAKPEVLRNAATAMFDNDIERRAETVAIVMMQERQPDPRRAMQRIRIQPQQFADIGPRQNLVARHIPIPDQIAGAGDRHGLPFQVAEQALLQSAPGEGVLHHRKADEQNDQHQAAAQRRLNNVIIKSTGDGHVSPDHP